MEHKELRKTMTARFYQSLAEQDVQIDALPPAQLQALVDALADSLTEALDAIESEGAKAAPSGTQPQDTPYDNSEETLLWTGRPYLSIGIRYQLTTQRLRISRGLLGHSFEEIELVRVRDSSVSQHVGERAINVGDITVVSNDPRSPEFVLHNVKDPLEVRELIRKATLAEKERRGLHYQEEM